MMNFLRHLDLKLFYLINDKMSNSFFDKVMPWCRDKNNWIPLYVVLVIWVIYIFRKEAWKVIGAAIILVACTDQISSSVIKPLVGRLRPCHNPSLVGHMHLLVDCGGGLSFVSSHAANHFGLAVFLSVILGKRFPWVVPVLLFWAFLISISQVYVGVHYPLDVTGGALLGICFGYIAGKLVNRWTNKTVILGAS
jgi:membrane-associated phospholipid phosphatase